MAGAQCGDGSSAACTGFLGAGYVCGGAHRSTSARRLGGRDLDQPTGAGSLDFCRWQRPVLWLDDCGNLPDCLGGGGIESAGMRKSKKLVQD